MWGGGARRVGGGRPSFPSAGTEPRLGDAKGVTIVEPTGDRRRRRRRSGYGEGTGRFLISIGGRLLVQFKKLDRDFGTRNYPTRTAQRFDAQRVIEGCPRGTRVTVGYQLNSTAQELATVAVVCQGSLSPLWWYELGVEEPVAALSSSSPLQPARVLPKVQLDLGELNKTNK